MSARLLLGQVLVLVLVVALNNLLAATASSRFPAGVGSPLSIAAATRQRSENEQPRRRSNAYAGVIRKKGQAAAPKTGRAQGASAGAGAGAGTGAELISGSPRFPRNQHRRDRRSDAGGGRGSDTTRVTTSSFTTAFEAALQDAFQSIQVGDEATCRKKAATLLDILTRAIGKHDGGHADSGVHKGEGRPAVPTEPFHVDPTWSVQLTLGGAQGVEERKRAPIKIVLSVGCVLMDAYTSFPTVPEFRQVLVKLLQRGLNPNTVTPWMISQTLPLLWRALVHHRYDISLFQAIFHAAAGSRNVSSNSLIAPQHNSWFGSTVHNVALTANTQFAASAVVLQARQGISPLHLLLFPQETTDSTMKFLFEANKRLQSAMGNDDVEVTTDRLRFPGDVIHEFDGIETVSPTFRALRQVMSEMSLAMSSKISEEVADAHYSMWLSGPNGTPSSRQSSTPLCDVALQLPSNGWNALHVMATKGWHRLLKRMRLDMVAARNMTCTSNPARRLHAEIAAALSQGTFCCQQTPLHVAALHNHRQVYAELVKLWDLSTDGVNENTMPEQPHIDVLRNQPHQPLAHNASFRLASDQHDKPDNAAQRLRHLRQQTHARAAFKAGSKQKQKNELSQLEGSAKTSQPWEGSLSNAKVTAKAALAARLLTDAPNGTDAAEHVLQKGASTSKLNGNAQTSFCNIVDIRAMPNLRSMQEILIRQEPVIFRGAAEYFGLWHHVDDLTGMRTETEGTDVWSFQSLREDFGEVEVVTQATDAAGVQSIQHRRLKDFLGTFSSPAAIPECLSSSDLYLSNPQLLHGTNLTAPIDFMRAIPGLNVVQHTEESSTPGLEKSLRMFIGPATDSRAMHHHEMTLNILLHGRKHWTLLPPAQSYISSRPGPVWYSDFVFDRLQKKLSMGNFHVGNRTSSSSRCTSRADGSVRCNSEDSTWVHVNTTASYDYALCTQEKGDAILVPHEWGHATYSLQDSVGYAFMMDYTPYHSAVPGHDLEQAFHRRTAPQVLPEWVTAPNFHSWFHDIRAKDVGVDNSLKP
eukprot:INCI7442.2.p1 GENE.INCI7442.2~~INCI7442.2.p1  ORF type:complete len:1075 (+),score=182.32 INCI7442.2:126-3227(+)